MDNKTSTADDALNAAQKSVQAARAIHNVKKGVKAAKIAAGSATGVGGIAIAVWENKDLIAKFIAVICLVILIMAGIASSIPTSIINWANNTFDTSNGAEKTIQSYNEMVSAMKTGLEKEAQSFEKKADADAKKHNYVPQNSDKAKIMVTPELKKALHTDIKNITGNCPDAGSAIDTAVSQDYIAQDIINAYVNQTRSNAELARQEAETEARMEYEKQMNQSSQPVDKQVESSKAIAAGDAAYEKYIKAADIDGKSEKIKSAVSTDIITYPPYTVYKVSDNASGCGIDSGSTALAITCYSVYEGNDDKANPQEFENDIKAGASKYFTLTTETTVNSKTHQKTVTYKISYVNNGAQKMFGLSDTQYQQAAIMAVNLLTTISHLSGNGKSDDTFTELGQITGNDDTESRTGGLANLTGNISDLPISKNLVAFIESWEGYSPVAYRGADYLNETIGYGHVITSGETFSILTKEQAEKLLVTDLQTGGYINSVSSNFSGCKLTQNQFDALVSLAYNLGPNIWEKISLTSDIKNHESNSVLKTDFLALDHVYGSENSGLLRRRQAEWDMYESGKYELN